MPTPPDFTAGSVLTAAQMNQAGLWLVKTQTIGTGVSSVTVTNAFSADFDHYLITVGNGAQLSVDSHCRMTLGSANTGYFGSLVYVPWNTGTVTGAVDNNQTHWSWGGPAGVTLSGYIVLMNPFRADYTDITSRIRYSTVYGTYTGLLNNLNSYSSFTLSPASGTMTGGKIRVYGYRN